MLRSSNSICCLMVQIRSSKKNATIMKHPNRLIAVLAILLLPFISFTQDTGQKIRISQGLTVLGTYNVTAAPTDSESPAIVSINTATGINFEALDATPNTVGNRLCQGVTDGNCGWYKAFWIFGDGNYLSFPDNITALDAPSRRVDNYRYSNAGTYRPVVYLTEKYHNTKPPEEARAELQVANAAASGTYIELTRRLAASPGRTVDIDFNHSPRVDYPMNFVLSYRKQEPAEAVLFYYNSLYNSNTSIASPIDLFSFKRNEATAYQSAGFSPRVVHNLAEGIGARLGDLEDYEASGTILDALNTTFKSRLTYKVGDLQGGLPEGMTELRVFPVLQTLPRTSMPANLLTEVPATSFPYFAAILIGTEEVTDNDPAYAQLTKDASILFGNTGSLRLSPNSPFYIRGIQRLNLKMESSHDPNSLVVKEVQALGNGKFKVIFLLTICNKGQGSETSPTLVFRDLTAGKFATQPVLGNIGSVTPNWSGGSGAELWTVGLDGFVIPGVPEHYEPSCRELTFSMETDAAGVARLYQSAPRALEVCVRFSTGAGECNMNDPLVNDIPITEKLASLDCGTGQYGLLFFVLLLVLGIITLWFLFGGRNL